MAQVSLPAANLPATVAAGDLVIAVFQEGERYYAIADTCPHRGAPLSKGLLYQGDIICPRHSFRFSLETGQCRVPKTLRARTFPVRCEGETLVISVSD
jgi:nitrite reductase/ring-hydroxylating ferredoxin subunit